MFIHPRTATGMTAAVQASLVRHRARAALHILQLVLESLVAGLHRLIQWAANGHAAPIEDMGVDLP